MRIDVFCRVIDNYGDIGVCWRLCADLAQRGHRVRLWLSDARALAWMAPAGAPGVTLHAWIDADAEVEVDPGDVVIEAFGCDPPPAFIARMAAAASPPVWINLEYLSAESYVERSHGLPSPVNAGPGRGLTKWFYYPGFTPRTGGLLREPGLMDLRRRIHAEQPPAASVFCYDTPMLACLARAWPGTIYLAPGPAQTLQSPRARALPWLSQPAYDELLWRCSLNIVRGEDSFVRAQWSGAPFIWHIYPQSDGVHLVKLDAFLDRFLAGAEATFATALRTLWRAWNGAAPWPSVWPDEATWRACCERWRAALLEQPDLTTRILRFAGAKS